MPTRGGRGTIGARRCSPNCRGYDDLPVYRIAFHLVRRTRSARRRWPRRDRLDERRRSPAIDRRLDRLDRAARTGPWTAAMLALIARAPATGAPATWPQMLGREKEPFKLDVRKLKNLGLTLSLRSRLRISPRAPPAGVTSRRDEHRG